MIELLVPVLNGLFSLIGGAVGAAAFNHLFQQRRYRNEQLHEKYSEFVAIAADELDRSKNAEAMLALGSISAQGGKEAWVELYRKRDTARVGLLRVAFQIQLLERDQALSAQVEKIAESQPFIIPGHSGGENWGGSLEDYK